jgi:hypothetical protein
MVRLENRIELVAGRLIRARQQRALGLGGEFSHLLELVDDLRLGAAEGHGLVR